MKKQIIFDENGVGYGVVMVESMPEDAFELKFESNLANRYKLVNGKVVDQYKGKTEDEVLADMAAAAAKEAEQRLAEKAARDAEAAKAGVAAIEKARVITNLRFMDLFTAEELRTIYTVAKADVTVEIWLDKMRAAKEVILDEDRTVAGLNALKKAGLLTDARVARIRANQLPEPA